MRVDQTKNDALHDALVALPMRDRVMELMSAAVDGRDAAGAAMCLVTMAAIMGRYLGIADRARIKQHLHDEAELLDALVQ
jgi:hypothetical protein